MSATTSVPSSFAVEVSDYLEHSRKLGYGYRGVECVLSRLWRFLAARNATDLDAASYDAWCQYISVNKANSRRKAQQIVRRFTLHRARKKPQCFVPDQSSWTKPQPYVRPVIVNPEQVARMLAIASALPDRIDGSLRAAVNRIAVVLLYTTGLRTGELLRLAVSDRADNGRVLQIRESKFHRSRLVSLSHSTQRELDRYMRDRTRCFPEHQDNGPLLCHRVRGQLRGYSKPGMASLVANLFAAAHVRDAEGRQPRAHDLRHSFAIQALMRAYRAGGDPQSALPKLALFMGHVSIESTLHYVKLVPELAALASARFEAHFGEVLEGGKE